MDGLSVSGGKVFKFSEETLERVAFAVKRQPFSAVRVAIQ